MPDKLVVFGDGEMAGSRKLFAVVILLISREIFYLCPISGGRELLRLVSECLIGVVSSKGLVLRIIS